MDIRNEAELVRRGLLARYLTVAEAVAWADSVIAREPQPPIEVIELALAGTRRPEDAAGELRPLTAGIPASALLAEMVGHMRAVLERDEQRAPVIAWNLFHLALSGVLPARTELADLYSVAYEFDPEEAAWASSRDDAVRYLHQTLERLASALAPAV
jgi:hypothetical protein